MSMIMYIPNDFIETNDNEVIRLITEYPLASLICYHDSKIIAHHLPLMMDSDDVLIGHIAKANALHNMINNNSDILAIFHGEDSYISPNYYPSKPKTHRFVPTWNYQIVHIRGSITFQHDKKSKLAAVGKLTKHHENKLFSNSNLGYKSNLEYKPWKMSDAPKDYIDMMIDDIVAFKIDITTITAKSKLSQNRASEDFDNVTKTMQDTGKHNLYQRMTRLKR